MNKKMEEPGLNSPKTIPEIGIHIGFMWQKLEEIREDHRNGHASLNNKLEELIQKSPTRKEYEELDKEVKVHTTLLDTYKGDRRWVIGVGCTLVFLMGALLLLVRLYVKDVATTAAKEALQSLLSEYNLEIK